MKMWTGSLHALGHPFSEYQTGGTIHVIMLVTGYRRSNYSKPSNEAPHLDDAYTSPLWDFAQRCWQGRVRREKQPQHLCSASARGSRRPTKGCRRHHSQNHKGCQKLLSHLLRLYKALRRVYIYIYICILSLISPTVQQPSKPVASTAYRLPSCTGSSSLWGYQYLGGSQWERITGGNFNQWKN